MKTGLMKPFITSLAVSSILLLAMFAWGSNKGTQAARTAQPQNNNGIVLAAPDQTETPTFGLVAAEVLPANHEITTATMEYSDTTIWSNKTYFILTSTHFVTVTLNITDEEMMETWTFDAEEEAQGTKNSTSGNKKMIDTEATTDTGIFTRKFWYHFDAVDSHTFSATAELSGTSPLSKTEFWGYPRVQPSNIDFQGMDDEVWLGENITPTVEISPDVSNRTNDSIWVDLGDGNTPTSLPVSDGESDGNTTTVTTTHTYTMPGTYDIDAEYDDDDTDRIVAEMLEASTAVTVKAPTLEVWVDGKTDSGTVVMSGTVPVSATIDEGTPIDPAYVKFEITEGMTMPALAATDSFTEDISGEMEAGRDYTFTGSDEYSQTYTVTASLMSAMFKGEGGDDVIASDWMTITVPAEGPGPMLPYLDDIALKSDREGPVNLDEDAEKFYIVTIDLFDNESNTWVETTTVNLDLSGSGAFTPSLTALQGESGSVEVVDGTHQVSVTSSVSEVVTLRASATNDNDKVISDTIELKFVKSVSDGDPCEGKDNCTVITSEGGTVQLTSSDDVNKFFRLNIPAGAYPNGLVVVVQYVTTAPEPDQISGDPLQFFQIMCYEADGATQITCPAPQQPLTVEVGAVQGTTALAQEVTIPDIGTDVYTPALGLSAYTTSWSDLGATANTGTPIVVTASNVDSLDEYYALTDGGRPTIYLPLIRR